MGKGLGDRGDKGKKKGVKEGKGLGCKPIFLVFKLTLI